MKKVLGIFLAVMMLATSFAAMPLVGLANEDASLVVEINGEVVTLDPAPRVTGENLYLPIIALSNDLGWKVEDAEFKTVVAASCNTHNEMIKEASVIVVNGEKTFEFSHHLNQVKINGQAFTTDAHNFAVKDGEMYVPLSALEAIGMKAVWHRSANVVELTVDMMDGKYFQIVQASTGKAFTLENGNLGDGVRIVLGDADETDEKQLWRFSSRGDGRYAVVNKKSRRSFDIPNGRSDIDLNLIIYGVTDGPNQWIRPVKFGDGTYLLQCAHDEKLYMYVRDDGVIAQNLRYENANQIFELREVEVSAPVVSGIKGGAVAEPDELNGKLVSFGYFEAETEDAFDDPSFLNCLTPVNNSLEPGAEITLTAPQNTAAQTWRIVLRGNDGKYNRYQLINRASGLALTAKDGKLTQEEPTLNTDQMFEFGENAVFFRNVASGEYIALVDGKLTMSKDKAGMFVKSVSDLSEDSYEKETIGGKFYRITEVSTGKAVSVADENTNNGAAITVADANDSDIQVWNLMTQGGGRYIITNKLSRRSWDIPGGSKEEGTSVTQYDTNFGNNQIFRLVPAGGSTYYIMNKGSELYVTEKDGKFTQEALGHEGNQLFTLTQVGESDEKVIGAAATLFVLKGEDKVTNAKIQWATITGAAKYDVYRSVDGGDYTLMASMTGMTIDDYDLEIGKSYTYAVYAMDDEGNMIDNALTNTVEPYALPADLKSSSNLQESGFGRPNSLCVDGVYYRFSEWGGGQEWRLMMRTSTDDITYSEPVEVLNATEILAHETCQNFQSARFESQNFVYNPIKNKFAFIAHFEADGGYGTAMTSIATATPGERFTFHGAFRPEGGDTRDLNVYVDDDYKAYIIAAINVNADLALYELNEDWSGVERMVCIVNRSSWRELPGMIKVDGIYYLFTSGTAGWYPTQGMYNTATSIDGPWSPLRVVGNTTTFSSQSGSVSRLKPGSENYMMSTYRWMYFWQDAVVKRTTNRRYPISVHDGFAFYDFYDELLYSWDNDYLIPVQNGRILSQDMPVTSDSLFGDSNLANDGNYRTIWTAGSLDGVDSEWPYTWEVDLGEVRELSELQISWLIWNGSEPYYQYKVEASINGRKYTTILDNTEGYTDYGFTVDQLSGSARFVRITVEDAKPRSHPDDNNYPPQIFEVKVLGK